MPHRPPFSRRRHFLAHGVYFSSVPEIWTTEYDFPPAPNPQTPGGARRRLLPATRIKIGVSHQGRGLLLGFGRFKVFKGLA